MSNINLLTHIRKLIRFMHTVSIRSIKAGGNKKWDITAETQRTQRESFLFFGLSPKNKNTGYSAFW